MREIVTTGERMGLVHPLPKTQRGPLAENKAVEGGGVILILAKHIAHRDLCRCHARPWS